jgi:uncharacterized membrane protein
MNGIWIGIFIGIVCGFVFIVFVREAKKKGDQSISLVGKVLALPAFCFGGPWLTNTVVLKDVQWNAILPWYLGALTCTFALIVMYDLYQFVIVDGNAKGKGDGANG